MRKLGFFWWRCVIFLTHFWGASWSWSSVWDVGADSLIFHKWALEKSTFSTLWWVTASSSTIQTATDQKNLISSGMMHGGRAEPCSSGNLLQLDYSAILNQQRWNQWVDTRVSCWCCIEGPGGSDVHVKMIWQFWQLLSDVLNCLSGGLAHQSHVSLRLFFHIQKGDVQISEQITSTDRCHLPTDMSEGVFD